MLPSQLNSRNEKDNNKNTTMALGLLHRLDGPAFEIFYSNGKIKSKEYYTDGNFRRIDKGILYIKYDINGKIIRYY